LHLCSVENAELGSVLNRNKIFNQYKTRIMRTIEETQCPNCWGYQTYDEQNQEQQLCECK